MEFAWIRGDGAVGRPCPLEHPRLSTTGPARELMIFVHQLATLLIVLIGLVVGAIAVGVFLPIAR